MELAQSQVADLVSVAYLAVLAFYLAKTGPQKPQPFVHRLAEWQKKQMS